MHKTGLIEIGSAGGNCAIFVVCKLICVDKLEKKAYVCSGDMMDDRVNKA